MKEKIKQLEDKICQLAEEEFDTNVLTIEDFDLHYENMLITHLYCNKDLSPKIIFTNGTEEEKYSEEINIDKDSEEYYNILLYIYNNI